MKIQVAGLLKPAQNLRLMRGTTLTQVKHEYVVHRHPDPNNPGSEIQELHYVTSYVPPETSPANPSVASTNPENMLDPVGYKAGWTVPTTTPETKYTVGVELHNATNGQSYIMSAPSTAGSKTATAADLGNSWYNSDDIYAHLWYSNNKGAGPEVRAPSTGYI